MLPRKLEPEVMATVEEALDYDAMDHSEVNRKFVDDLLAAGPLAGDVLDLGTGTAQIPIELCRRVPDCRVMAVDLSQPMLELARYRIEAAGLIERIQLDQVDAKQLPWPADSFAAVISNSIAHHVAEPAGVLREAVRVVAPQGRLFFRDLLRPASQAALDELVDGYAGDENEHCRQMFADSLHAALSLAEVRELVAALGFAPENVCASSDRHWTWSARKTPE